MKDIDFSVDDPSGNERIFTTFAEACAYAVVLGVSDGKPHAVNVLIYSRAAARAWGGEDAAEEYDADPDASVSQRISIHADDLGRVA